MSLRLATVSERFLPILQSLACGRHRCNRGCHLPLTGGERWAEIDNGAS